jgi:hypothetical protein
MHSRSGRRPASGIWVTWSVALAGLATTALTWSRLAGARCSWCSASDTRPPRLARKSSGVCMGAWWTTELIEHSWPPLRVCPLPRDGGSAQSRSKSGMRRSLSHDGADSTRSLLPGWGCHVHARSRGHPLRHPGVSHSHPESLPSAAANRLLKRGEGTSPTRQDAVDQKREQDEKK